MRARHFIIEYDRTKTAQAFSAKMVNQTLNDPTVPGAVKNNIKTMDPVEAAEMILQHQIEIGDPTKQKKYAQALARMYANGLIRWEDVTSTLRDYLEKFAKLGIKKMLKPEHADFNRYKDLKTFYDAVDTYPDPEEGQEVKDKGSSKEVYKDENVRIIHPKDKEAACYYGQGTRWCTAAKNDNMFSHYNNDGPMYILLPTKPKYDGEKFQIHANSGQYMNHEDYRVEPRDLIERFGPGFEDWLINVGDPYLKRQVQYYPDDSKLEAAWRDIAEIVDDKIWDIMLDWETNDDYYYSWLRDNGYADDDEIKDDAPPYDEYNEEAGAWQHRMREVGQMSASEIKELAQQLEEDGGDPPDINDLDNVYSFAIEVAAERGRDGTGDLDFWTRRHVMVTYLGDPKKDAIKVERVTPRKEP